MDKYLINIASSQVSDGLDLFYTNDKNVNITAEKAFLIVLKILHKDPEDEVTELIQSWRK
jgi:hypothetical protein